MAHKYADKFYIDECDSETGPVVRWNSNNHIPFDDMLGEFVKAGLINALERENSNRQREVETATFIANYRANYVKPSMEQILEAKAAYGPGVVVVNVFTGHKFTT